MTDGLADLPTDCCQCPLRGRAHPSFFVRPFAITVTSGCSFVLLYSYTLHSSCSYCCSSCSWNTVRGLPCATFDLLHLLGTHQRTEEYRHAHLTTIDPSLHAVLPTAGKGRKNINANISICIKNDLQYRIKRSKSSEGGRSSSDIYT